MKKSGRAFAAVMASAAAVAFVLPADALDDSEARERAQRAVQTVESRYSTVRAAMARARRGRPTPQKRIAAGELLLRTGDYESAIDTLSKVVELYRQGKVPETSYADGLFFLAEAYFQDEQYLSARRHYREIVEKGEQTPFAPYAGRALGRLVDVVLRTRHDEGLDYVFQRMNELPQSDASGSLQYARGKAYYARQQYDQAKAALAGVGTGSDYAHQAGYLTGVILMKEALLVPEAEPPQGSNQSPPRQRFGTAIAQFRRVTNLPADTDEHRHVIDLAWMAIGRLLYESENYLDSAEAYSHVDRTSPEFSEMLFELAWVYVRLGDYQRAQRALEVLTIAAPESLRFADGSLLRADLMLRSGMFDRALKLYENVREQYDPMREQVDAFLTGTTDPTVYYDRLVEEEFERKRAGLPQVVVDWVREEAEDDRVFAVIDDVTRSRDLIRKSRRLAQKLNAVLGSSTRVKAFPEFKAGLERVLSLQNRLALARRDLALGMEDVEDSSLSGEIGQVRSQRRALMKRLEWLPVTDGDFARREASGERRWNAVSQKIHNLTLEADRLQALVNGLKRVLKEANKFGVTHDAASRQRFAAEVEANERDLEAYRKRIETYRQAVDMGRAQSGFGDQSFVRDDRIRERFKQVLAREVQLAAAGQGGSDLAEYARSIQPVLARADRADARLAGMRADLEAQVARGAGELRALVIREAQNIEEYALALDSLDQNSRLLVGEVAMRNFQLVRDKLKGIVLRADVGIVQQAWEVREEHRSRVRALQRERAREEQNLNDELREVLDDAGDTL